MSSFLVAPPTDLTMTIQSHMQLSYTSTTPRLKKLWKQLRVLLANKLIGQSLRKDRDLCSRVARLLEN